MPIFLKICFEFGKLKIQLKNRRASLYICRRPEWSYYRKAKESLCRRSLECQNIHSGGSIYKRSMGSLGYESNGVFRDRAEDDFIDQRKTLKAIFFVEEPEVFTGDPEGV